MTGALSPRSLPSSVGEGHTWFPASWTQPQHSASSQCRRCFPWWGSGGVEFFIYWAQNKKGRKKPEHPITPRVRLQFQTWNSLCSLSPPPSALPAPHLPPPTTAQHFLGFFFFFLFLGIPTLCFSHLSTRQSFPRLLPMSLGHCCWTGLLQSTTIHPNSFHCPWECWNSSCPTTTTQLFLELKLPMFCKISACLSSLFSLCTFLASYWLTSYIWRPPGPLVFFQSTL